MTEKKIYIIFKKNQKMLTGHAITIETPNEEFISSIFNDKENDKTNDFSVENQGSLESKNEFYVVEQSFVQAISMYRDAIMWTIRISPMVSSAIVANQLGQYAERRGKKLAELCGDSTDVYELPLHSFSSVMRKNDEAIAALNGAKQLPQIAIIGIISAYDAFLADLLKVIFNLKPQLIFNSEREIKFSDLISFSSIEDVKNSIISDEIESVLRKSHHEQFAWMEKKFSIKLRENLDVWPDFIELCERRNLLTHTGGVISEQYIKNCKEHGCKISAKIGDRVNVDIAYLETAIEIVAEIGLKLIHTLWRKFNERERERADNTLNECGMNLIRGRQYKTAEKVLRFGVTQRKHNSERIRRMMVVNLANAIKLSERVEEAKKILKEEDWSATSPQFQICVAAVADEHDKVCELLRLGPKMIGISASDFRDWPVFRSSRKVEAVIEAFQEVFGEPLMPTEKIDVLENGHRTNNDVEIEDNGTEDFPNIVH